MVQKVKNKDPQYTKHYKKKQQPITDQQNQMMSYPCRCICKQNIPSCSTYWPYKSIICPNYSFLTVVHNMLYFVRTG